MLIHQYDSTNGQYISSRLADADPRREGRWLIPAHCTSEPLPERTPLTWPFFCNGAWTLRPDYRARLLYRTDTGEPAEILVAGTTPAQNGLTDTLRPSDKHIWRDGKWALDLDAVAREKHAAAMAEFETRLNNARTMNAGKADAYSAGLLSNEQAYYFRQWAAYQLALTRAIQQEGFPDDVAWPDEPAAYAGVHAAAMAEFDARLAKARAQLEGKAHADEILSPEQCYTVTAWSAYIDALKRAVKSDAFPDAVTWPDAPQPYTPSAQPRPPKPPKLPKPLSKPEPVGARRGVVPRTAQRPN
ncbi:hypothetical protein DFQ28_001742 [Apophysomyces sp. BC1034]|nr:hypothetical protein DFQ30_001757 [Apophysomyces sp. BC1015]KAG0190627.1 hypothetical protein DFQ28_001742 [Apophysomyces sp. BC1034]